MDFLVQKLGCSIMMLAEYAARFDCTIDCSCLNVCPSSEAVQDLSIFRYCAWIDFACRTSQTSRTSACAHAFLCIVYAKKLYKLLCADTPEDEKPHGMHALPHGHFCRHALQKIAQSGVRCALAPHVELYATVEPPQPHKSGKLLICGLLSVHPQHKGALLIIDHVRLVRVGDTDGQLHLDKEPACTYATIALQQQT